MTLDKSRVFFWKERKRLKRNETNNCFTVKDRNGNRQCDPIEVMNTTATFYENLYAKNETRPHNHHGIVKEEVKKFESNENYEQEWYNEIPTENEVRAIIEQGHRHKSRALVREHVKNL